jgi:hypothetical protein
LAPCGFAPRLLAAVSAVGCAGWRLLETLACYVRGRCAGFVPTENLRFREESLTFKVAEQDTKEEEVKKFLRYQYPAMKKTQVCLCRKLCKEWHAACTQCCHLNDVRGLPWYQLAVCMWLDKVCERLWHEGQTVTIGTKNRAHSPSALRQAVSPPVPNSASVV